MLRTCVLNATLLLDQQEGQQKLFSVENIKSSSEISGYKKGESLI